MIDGKPGVLIQPDGECSYKDCKDPAVFVVFCSSITMNPNGMFCFMPCVNHIEEANNAMADHLKRTSEIANETKETMENVERYNPGVN